MRVLFAVTLALFLVSCSAIAPRSPEQAVFAASTAFNGALTVAVTYESLPRCEEPAVQPCSDPEIVEQLRSLANSGDKVLTTLEDAVRNGLLSSDSVDQYIETLKTITSDIKGLVPKGA